jgi:hypothetical protein
MLTTKARDANPCPENGCVRTARACDHVCHMPVIYQKENGRWGWACTEPCDARGTSYVTEDDAEDAASDHYASVLPTTEAFMALLDDEYRV